MNLDKIVLGPMSHELMRQYAKDAIKTKMIRTDTEFKERGTTQWSNEMGRPVQYVRAMFARELEYELERLKDENPQCDDVYWSDHWECYYARWTNGQVEPLRDGEAARQLAYKWGIRFRNGAVAPPPEDNVSDHRHSP